MIAFQRHLASLRTSLAFVLCLAGMLAPLGAASNGQATTPQGDRPTTEKEAAQDQQSHNAPQVTQRQLEEKFQERLENSVWTGRFTVLGREDQMLAEERYEIHSVEKMEQEDFWKIEARVQYGERDFTMPFVVQVKWAGTTPVITVDRLLIPSMGIFDARVLLRHDQYAGTWAHDDVRGHMFGTFKKIERPKDR